MSAYYEQEAFNPYVTEFADNPESRCPCLLILDTSGSMQGEPIRELNQGLITLRDELLEDDLASKRAEIGVISFGPVIPEREFTTVEQFDPPTLKAAGTTPMGEAIEHGIERIKQRKETYKQAGVGYYRPWIFLITDGAPTDSWKHAAKLVREGEDDESFAFFAIGVKGARMDVLEQIAVRQPRKLQELQFRELFQWLSASLKAVSRSRTDEKVGLPETTGWEAV
jgi:uncharacterized protein YegL